jgi:NTE family protein
VAEGVRATISVPGVFAEVRSEGMRLVDGGILDNVPVETARSMAGDGPVVAVDVLPGFRANEPGESRTVAPLKMRSFPGIMNDSLHMIMVMISEMTAMHLEVSPPDMVIRPEIPEEVTILTGFGEAGAVIEAGRRAATEAVPALRALLEETD